MQVTDDLIEKLARLSRLQFQQEEKEEIRKDLEKMIGFISKLNELDTTGVKPLMHMSDEINVFREDEAKSFTSREEALKNAPLHDGIFFKTPKAIKK
ncbi:MAG: Asp-tRNA(Asn)/Glu-tRNA(Gln) amidotransferase GatCAB subunit C [Chitinophagaceae bacterium]